MTGRSSATRRCKSIRDTAGQASVELVALLPLVFVVGLAILTVLAARAASGDAAAAAQAGAMAIIQDEDARAAAADALPAGVRGRADIRVRGREISVTVRPSLLLPFVSDSLAATATASAGPAPR